MNLPFDDKTLRRIGYGTAALILAAGVLIRFFRLNLDPPLFFTGASQDLLTDPYNFIAFARNKVLFGSWDIFDYARWIAFKYSLTSAAAYITFVLGGVSRVTANLSAVLLNLGGIFLFLAALWKYSRKTALISGIIILSNMTLIVYGRFPFLENGLIFFCGLTAFIFLKYYPKAWAIVATGVLIAAGGLSGKMYGLLMVVPPAIVIWMEDKINGITKIGLMLISAVISFVALAAIFYGGNIGKVYEYLTEQTVGMYGAPTALTSVKGFLEGAITFGGQSRLFYYASPLLLLLFIAAALLILSSGRGKSSKRLDRALVFNIGWLLAGFGLLMLFNYRPLRYQLFLLLPMAGMIASIMNRKLSDDNKAQIGIIHIIILLFVCWYFCTQAVLTIVPEPTAGNAIAWYCLGPALLSAILIFGGRNWFVKIVTRAQIAFGLLLILYLVSQGVWLYKWMDKGTYNMKRAGEDLVQIVDDGAVLAGPFSQSLSIDNRLRSVIYMFGLIRKEPDLFRRFPITHLTTDVSNWELATRDYPELSTSLSITRYWIRDVGVEIYMLGGWDRQTAGSRYRLTDYERAAIYFNERMADSAGYYIDRFLEQYPRNRSGGWMQASIYFASGMFDLGFESCRRLIGYYPDDYSLYFDVGLYYYRLYCMTGELILLTESNGLFNKARNLNPYIEHDITEARNQADRMFRR